MCLEDEIQIIDEQFRQFIIEQTNGVETNEVEFIKEKTIEELLEYLAFFEKKVFDKDTYQGCKNDACFLKLLDILLERQKENNYVRGCLKNIRNLKGDEYKSVRQDAGGSIKYNYFYINLIEKYF